MMGIMPRITGPLAIIVLVLLGVLFFVRPDLAHRLSGYEPLEPPGPEEVENPAPLDEGAALRFFEERNGVELTVPRDMEAAELLRLYQIDFPHVRRQIAEQRGVQQRDSQQQAGQEGTSLILRDRDVLKRGERYLLTLTPPAEGLP